MRKVAFYIAFALVAVSVGAYMAREPWGRYQEERALAKRANEEMKKAEAERAELVRQRAKVKSPAGREELLRDNGYVKKGEQPLDMR